MLRHVAMGYTVHLQRVLGHVTWWMLPHTLPGYSDHTQEGYQKRTFVFKLCEFCIESCTGSRSMGSIFIGSRSIGSRAISTLLFVCFLNASGLSKKSIKRHFVDFSGVRTA